MAKIRIEKRYATIPNSILNCKDISFRAKGIWAYIYSKPDGWNFSIKNIANQSKEGREAIKNAIKELETQHLLKRTKFQNELGYWDVEYLLLEHNVGKSCDGKPVTGKPVTGKPANNSNKELSKKDIVKKKETISENKFSQEIITILDLFSQINPSIQYGNKTQRKVCEDMIKKYRSDNVINMVKQVISVQGEKYAPVATTPYAMYKKLGEFKIYFEKQKKANGELLDLS